MSNKENELAQDREISSLYGQSKHLVENEALSHPRKEIDTAMKAAARKAVHPTTSSGPFSGKWQVPASLAAVLVISVGIVNYIGQESTTVQLEEKMSMFNEHLGSNKGTPNIEAEQGKNNSKPSKNVLTKVAPSPIVNNEAADVKLRDTKITEVKRSRESFKFQQRKESTQKKSTKAKVDLVQEFPAAINKRKPASLPIAKTEKRVNQDRITGNTTTGGRTKTLEVPVINLQQRLANIRSLRTQGHLERSITLLDDIISQYQLIPNKKTTPAKQDLVLLDKTVLNQIIEELELQSRPALAQKLKDNN